MSRLLGKVIMDRVRKTWAMDIGKPSNLVVELQLEVKESGYSDPPCKILGVVGVPNLPNNDAEQLCVAMALVEKTNLQILMPNMEIRILGMKTRRLSTAKRDIALKKITMSRSLAMRNEYVENPYLRSMSMKELNQRFHDVMVNLQTISNGGRITLRADNEGLQWLAYFEHVFMEAEMRQLPYPLFLDGRYKPDWDKDGFFTSVKTDHSKRASGLVSKWKGNIDAVQLVKYGEYRYMKGFLKEGTMLVSPSRSFENEGYNQALRDDENSMSVFGVRTGNDEITPAHSIPSWWGDRYSMREFTSSMDRDYFLYCMGESLSPTLFSHFGQDYDACVVVYDMEELLRRVETGARTVFKSSEFVYSCSRVTYIDPLGAIPPVPAVANVSAFQIPFLKHFRHRYQDEFRFVWVPQAPMRNFNKVLVTIGSIEDIAEIIRI